MTLLFPLTIVTIATTEDKTGSQHSASAHVPRLLPSMGISYSILFGGHSLHKAIGAFLLAIWRFEQTGHLCASPMDPAFGRFFKSWRGPSADRCLGQSNAEERLFVRHGLSTLWRGNT